MFLRSFFPALLLLGLACVLFCSSCAVQKRRYLPGYYVSVKAPKARSVVPVPLPVATEAERPVKNVLAAAPVLKDTLPAEAPASVFKTPPRSSATKLKRLFSAGPLPTAHALLSPVVGSKSAKPQEPQPTEKKKLLVEALMSFLSTILGFTFLLFFAFFDLPFLPMELTIALMIFCLVSAYVMGMIALIKKVKEPDKYRGVWMAALSIMLVTVALGFLILDTGF